MADADAIAVLDGGVVAELGTHAELLARNGLYAALWRRHAREAAKEEQAAVTDGSAGADAEGSTSPAPT